MDAPPPPPTVMLVEDNVAMRTMQRFLLERAGYQVLECGDYRQAQQLLRGTAPAVLILDVNLPGGSGLDLLQYLDRTRTRVLVMSAMAQAHRAEHNANRADAFLAKPFDPQAFTTLVQQLAVR